MRRRVVAALEPTIRLIKRFVPDAEIRPAVRLMIETTRNLVEPAGAAPLAAALRLKEQLAGKRIALILSGSNVTPAQLRDLLS